MKYITFFFIILFSASCEKNIRVQDNIEDEIYEVIKLNVEELEIETEETILNDSDKEIKKINESVYKKLQNWATKKFSVLGQTNKSIIKLSRTDIKIKKKIANSGLKKMFYTEKRDYKINTQLKIIFLGENNKSKKLNLYGSIDLLIDDNFSLNEKNKKIEKTTSALINALDDEINKQLKKIDFKKFIY